MTFQLQIVDKKTKKMKKGNTTKVIIKSSDMAIQIKNNRKCLSCLVITEIENKAMCGTHY